MKLSLILTAAPTADACTTTMHATTAAGCRLVCTGCGDVVRFDAGGLGPVRDDLERRIGFVVVEEEFEVFGRCPSCRLVLARDPAAWGRA